MKKNIPTAIALFLGIIIGSVLPTLGAKAQDDVLYASRIIIPDNGLQFATEDGETVAAVLQIPTGGELVVYTNENELSAGLCAGEDGGALLISNGEGGLAIEISTAEYGGFLSLNNNLTGEPVVLVGTSKSRGHVFVYNTDGELVWGSS